MCGFAGILDPKRRWDGAGMGRLASSMAEALAHRGPDDAGVWTDAEAGIALGHRRLAVMDLSPAGRQPMVSASGRYVIAYNGEIYNFRELRAELERAGRAPAWRGHSDTEVLLAGFEAWGVEATLRRAVGMFAFALWDATERALWLARDRMGEKPLYYGWVAGSLAFSSELKALRRVPGWRGEVDRAALALFLRHNYVPAPWSIHRDVRKVPPGHLVRFDAGAVPGHWPELRPYWSLTEIADRGLADPLPPDPEVCAEAVEEALRRSLAGQQLADVPVGAFLSGGIDSSTVVALLQAMAGRPVRTFTIGFHEAGYDEAREAAQVARHLGTEHTELYVTPREAMEVIPRLPEIYDEPFADSSQIPTFLVSRLAREHVTVALSGDGGDELFGGYNRYVWALGLWRRLDRLPRPLRALAARAIRAVPPGAWERLFALAGPLLPAGLRVRQPGLKMHKLAELLRCADPGAIYLRLVSHWEDPASVVLGAGEPATVLSDPGRQPRLPTFLERMMCLDALTYLPDDILVKVDRAAMAVSLETRVPFLDHRVVETAWRVPVALKLREGKGKWLLRRILHRHVPPELVERPKMGFGVPIEHWLRGPLRDWAEALLDEARLRREGYLDPAPVRRLWWEHLAGRGSWQYWLWDVLAFQAWLEQGGARAGPPAAV
ncbi:MAG: asparagine synthase (glutamine-hydrolyzing) [Gammaproteobacteria bacterium]|nr:MAG: asparagine synthase (glutamine-hydrolyzing) [Gammaproteobacteria bacterium]